MEEFFEKFQGRIGDVFSEVAKGQLSRALVCITPLAQRPAAFLLRSLKSAVVDLWVDFKSFPLWAKALLGGWTGLYLAVGSMDMLGYPPPFAAELVMVGVPVYLVGHIVLAKTSSFLKILGRGLRS